MLIEMPPSFPVALGVIYEDAAPTFESAVVDQNAAAVLPDAAAAVCSTTALSKVGAGSS